MSSSTPQKPMPGSNTPAPIRPCDLFSEDIHLLVDGELGVAETALVEEHLQVCSRCLALAAKLEAMSSMLKDWDTRTNDLPAPALRIQHGVLARVAEHSQRRRRESRLVGLLHHATAALVLLALGLGTWLGLREATSGLREATSALREATPTGAPGAVAARISDAPFPFERPAAPSPAAPFVSGRALAALDLADEVARRASVPEFAPLRSLENEPDWDRHGAWAELWKQDAPRVVFLAERAQREDALAARLGRAVTRWPGPYLDEPGQRLITVKAFNWLHEGGRKNYLQEWKRAAPQPHEAGSTTGEFRRRPAERLPTDMTAADMLAPMPGVDRELKSLFMGGRFGAFFAIQPSEARAGRKKRIANPAALLEAWPLALEPSGLFESGPIRAGLRSFMDPLKAEANGKLRLREEEDGDGSVVFIVEGTREPIFVPAGQFITGGLGTRVVAEATWLPASRGKTPQIVRCRMVQDPASRDGAGFPTLVPYVAGPTIRSLLSAEAAPAVVKDAARRIVALWQHPAYDMFNGWNLLDVYGNQSGKKYYEAFRDKLNWKKGRGGFVVRDARGRLVGIEAVRFEGPAAEELLRRLWTGYVAEALLRHGRLHPENRAFQRTRAEVDAALAPSSDELTQAFRRIAAHDAVFRMPRGFEPGRGFTVSNLEIVAAGLHLHALEVADRPMAISVVSGLQPAK